MSGDSPNSAIKDVMVRRAVAYVRMSTERQEYSTRNQLDTIEQYAADRSLELIAVYEDAGKSGLTKKGRPGLCRLIEDVCSGQPIPDTTLSFSSTTPGASPWLN